MIPVRLTIKGFLSYREAVELDFTQFDMAVVTGQNGAGKSSLLDAMTWALFGKARSNDDDLIHMQEQEAEVCLVFVYEGQQYAVTRMKRRAASKTMQLEIWSEEGCQWVNLTEATTTATQTKLERILRMDYETFINASFFLQGKADQFAQQRPSDRKNTLAKILELEIWDEYQKKAAAQRKLLEIRLITVNSLVDGIQRELAKESDLRSRRIALHEKLAQLEGTAKVQEEIVLQYRRQQEQAAKQKVHVDLLQSNYENARKRASDLQVTLEKYQAEQAELLNLLADEERILQAVEEWKEDRKNLEVLDQTARQFEVIRAEREAPQTIQTREEARIRATVAQLQNRALKMQDKEENLNNQTKLLQGTEEEEAAVEAETSRYIILEGHYDDLDAKIKDIELDRAKILREMQLIKERINKLEEVDEAVCPTCGQPLTREHRETLIEELRKQGSIHLVSFDQGAADLETKKDERNSLDGEIKRLQRLEKERLLKVIRPRLESLKDNISNIKAELDGWESSDKKTLIELEEMLANGRFALDARSTLLEIDARLQKLGYDVRQHEQYRQRERDGRKSQEAWQALSKARTTLETLDRLLEEYQGKVIILEDDVEGSQDAYQGAREQYEILAAGSEGFNEANQKWLEMRNAVSQTSRELGGAEQAVNALTGFKEQLESYVHEKQELLIRVDQYKQLEEAFSKNGVQALLIEQAIPEIEEQANEILSQLTSTGMMVQFRTQAGYRDRKRSDMKETLDIVISDNAGIRSYEMYSGGEAFRVNFAIRLALSRMLAGRAGARLQTLVIDEGFGSQDAEGVQRLIEAINAIQDDFAKILIITHMETLKENFPAQIEVIKTSTGSQFQVMV